MKRFIGRSIQYTKISESLRERSILVGNWSKWKERHGKVDRTYSDQFSFTTVRSSRLKCLEHAKT